jgi:pentatricopeptide repeat protein
MLPRAIVRISLSRRGGRLRSTGQDNAGCIPWLSIREQAPASSTKARREGIKGLPWGMSSSLLVPHLPSGLEGSNSQCIPGHGAFFTTSHLSSSDSPPADPATEATLTDSDMLRQKMARALRKGKLEEILEWLEKLQSTGEANAWHFNVAIAACARANDATRALEIFQMLETPDVYSYSALANAFVKVSRLDDAMRLIDDMETRGVRPNSVMYNVLLSGAVQQRKLQIAEYVLHRIKEERISIDEDMLIIKMRLAGLKMDAQAVTEEWKQCVDEIVITKQPCSRASLAALATCYNDCNRPDLAEGVLEVITNVQSGPHLKPLTAADLYSAVGMTWPSSSDDHAAAARGNEQQNSHGEVWRRKSVQIVQGRPWNQGEFHKHVLAAFESTISSYNRYGDKASSARVLRRLRDSGIVPGSSTTAVCFAGNLAQSTHKRRFNNKGEALERIKSLAVETIAKVDTGDEAAKQSATHVFNIALARSGNIAGLQGLEYVWTDVERKSEVQTDTVSWNTRLREHARARDASAAWETYDEMQARGIRPTEHSWVHFLTAHAQHPRVSTHEADMRVIQVLEEMESCGQSVTVPTGTALMRVLGQLGMVDEALNVFQLLRQCGEDLPTKVYATAIMAKMQNKVCRLLAL